MMKQRGAWLGGFLGVVALAGVALAGARAAENAWPEGDAADIAKVQAYLNDLTTYRARFIQMSSDGGYTDGTVWLSRPGLARFEYAPPNDLLLIADGTWLVFFDRDIDQVTHAAIDTGPFRFLLAETIDLSQDMVVQAVERSRGMLRVELIDEDDPDEGSITLVFEEDPMRLSEWRVLDSQGKHTSVIFYDDMFGLELDRALFRFTGNDRANPDYRRGTYE